VLVDTGEQRVFTKLRATAHGTAPLVAEVVVGELADALGIPTPARCLVELEPNLESEYPHEELLALLARSQGWNLGFEFLEGYRDVTVGDARRIPPAHAAPIIWLDALVENPDRTAQNPNLMIKAGRVTLIDNGAALMFQYDWENVTEQAPRAAGAYVENHLLQVTARELTECDARLGPRLTREVLENALQAVPPELFDSLVPSGSSPARHRALYVAYLWKRLRAPRPFVNPGGFTPFGSFQ
jgi:hypothetical protein